MKLIDWLKTIDIHSTKLEGRRFDAHCKHNGDVGACFTTSNNILWLKCFTCICDLYTSNKICQRFTLRPEEPFWANKARINRHKLPRVDWWIDCCARVYFLCTLVAKTYLVCDLVPHIADHLVEFCRLHIDGAVITSLAKIYSPSSLCYLPIGEDKLRLTYLFLREF